MARLSRETGLGRTARQNAEIPVLWLARTAFSSNSLFPLIRIWRSPVQALNRSAADPGR
jgi:hypothetical protein